MTMPVMARTASVLQPFVAMWQSVSILIGSKHLSVLNVMALTAVARSLMFINFGSRVYYNGCFYEEPHYMGIEVIDRVGSGDAYVAGVLYGILSGKSIDGAMSYGNALSAIKNTVSGDMSISFIDEVDSVIKAHKSEGIQDEMVR